MLDQTDPWSMPSASMMCCFSELPSCLPEKVDDTQRTTTKRCRPATDWLVEFASTTGTDVALVRRQVFNMFRGACVALLVCVEDDVQHMLPDGVVFANKTAMAPEQTAHSFKCLACARFTSRVSRRDVLALWRQAQLVEIDMKCAQPICNWRATVLQASKTDMDAAIMGISDSLLDWKHRLWMKIVYGGLRTIHSGDSIFSDTTANHVSATFRHLLQRYNKKMNLTDTRRVNYSICVDPKLIDDGIKGSPEWAKLVLDWFGERLEPANLNRRSLFLWGSAGVGKTRFLERLFEAQEWFRADGSSPFFLQGLCEDHRYVWLDEFVPEIVKGKEYIHQFNKLVGREHVVIRVKGAGAGQYEVNADNIRTVISSNEGPLSSDYFKRRFFVVKATNALYETPPKPRARKLSQQSNLTTTNLGMVPVEAGDSSGVKQAKWLVD